MNNTNKKESKYPKWLLVSFAFSLTGMFVSTLGSMIMITFGEIKEVIYFMLIGGFSIILCSSTIHYAEKFVKKERKHREISEKINKNY